MVRDGVMGPAASGEFIATRAEHVKIHKEGLEKLSQEILSSMKEGKIQIPDAGGDIHPSPDHPWAVDWVFVTDALNFCFWSLNQKQGWVVNGHTGYYALEAALFRAIKEGHDIANPAYYSRITSDELKHILRGDTDAPIPLFEDRLKVLHEVGGILLNKYEGSFKTAVNQAGKSAQKLLKIVVDDFPCFRDEAVYGGKDVSLYKRAQILVADLWNWFGGKGWGEFHDVDTLTMFADYRVPQVLVYFGAMSYSDELMKILKKGTLLQSGSQQEVEIRGCSIHAVEMLKRLIEEKIKGKDNLELPNSSLIDYYLWCYRRKYAKELMVIPFHKTLGIYY